METATFIIVIAGFAVVLLVQVWLLLRLKRMAANEGRLDEVRSKVEMVDSRFAGVESKVEAVRQEVVSTVYRSVTDLTERVASSSSEVRQKLSEDFLKIQQRVEEELREGRKDQETRLGLSSREMSASFESLRTGLVNLMKDFREEYERRESQVRQQIGSDLAGGRKELQEALQKTTTALEGKFGQLEKKTDDRLEMIRQAVDARLAAIGENVQTKLNENIKEGFEHFKEVQRSLVAAEEQLRNVSTVGTSITELNDLLKLPHLRGKFGEMSLDRLLTDFLPNHLVERDASIEGAGQVEFLIRFPKAKLPIDSKFPREQVAGVFETNDPLELKEARKKFARVMKEEAGRIAKYIKAEAGTMDMALMFLPSESLYFEAIRDEGLWGELSKKKVYPVSPNTLAITLKGIAIASDYYEMGKGVEKTIEEVRKAQKHFGNFQKKFEEVGGELEKAQRAFSTAAGHLGRYSSTVTRLTGEEPQALPESVEVQQSLPAPKSEAHSQ